MKLLSIVVPMFNVEKYLQKCIHSLFAQKLDDKEYEIILVDDESPDNSFELARFLVKGKKNVKIVRQKNKGLGGARNTGIENASGKYILFLDADDFYINNSVRKIIDLAEKYQLDILEFGAKIINQDNKVIYTLSKSNEPKTLSGVNYYNSLRYMPSACNKLYNLSFLKKNNLVFLKHIYGEDFEFNTRVLYLAKKVMATDHVVAKFYQSENSITRSKNSSQKRKYINDLIFSLIEIKNFESKNSSTSTKETRLFFDEIMTMTVITIFYKILFSDFTINEVMTLRKRLQNENVFKINHKVRDEKKEWFRKYLLGYNLNFYKLIFSLKYFYSK